MHEKNTKYRTIVKFTNRTPPPPPLTRDRRGRGGAMSHSINRLFPFLTIHRVGVEVVSCQACPVDYVFQPCGTGSSSSPLAIHWPLQDSRRKVACSICVPVELHFPLLYYIVNSGSWRPIIDVISSLIDRPTYYWYRWFIRPLFDKGKISKGGLVLIGSNVYFANIDALF